MVTGFRFHRGFKMPFHLHHSRRDIPHFLLSVIGILTVGYIIVIETSERPTSGVRSRLVHIQPTFSGGRNVMRNRSQVDTGDTTESYSPPNVGYFEGVRKFWTYPLLFSTPESPRKCRCPGTDGVPQEVTVTLEKNASRTGEYDILFIPRDVGIFPDKEEVWETISSVAPSTQRRVYASFEGAGRLEFLTPLGSRFRDKFFHWSWTQHSNSDFPMPYGFFRHSASKMEGVTGRNWAEHKTGLVAWMSTWSGKYWRRADFVGLLRKNLKIDCFGETNGYRRCPRNSKECEETIRKYKFYLALENSCCSEYITEKFWRTLAWDMVPIVFGANRSDYERVAPPNSFIYIDDFASVGEFVDYIKFLDKNDDEYNKYFAWKSLGDVVVNYPPFHDKFVKNVDPPETFFYSCKAVCRVTEKYVKERHVNVSRYFDPNSDWWCGSCAKCGQHKWIQGFAKSVK